MSKRKSMSWVQLRVGLLVIASFVLLGFGIFFISGEMGFFAPKFTLKVYFPSANGLRNGAEVWLDGVAVGSVRSVRVSSFAEAQKSVEVMLSIDRRYLSQIRSDSAAIIGSIGLLGDKYVEISRGTPSAAALPPDATLQGSEEGDIKNLITGTNDFLANLDVLSEQFQQIAGRVQRGEGTLGKMLTDSSIYNNVNATVQEANALVHSARAGDGTVGRLMSDDRLYTRINETVSRLESIATKVEKGEGTLGKFINDPSLYTKADELVSRVNTVVDRIEKGEGTLGRLANDQKLYNDTQKAMEKIATIAAALENGQGTAGRLIHDATLYNNLNQTSSEMMKLMYDFRQNPKKFLTINFKLF